MYYVYAYFRPGEQLPFYIGKGRGKRATDHLNKPRGKTFFYKELRTLLAKGIAPQIVILKRFKKEKDAYNYEVEMIAKYGRLDLGTGSLTNHTFGGKGFSGMIGCGDLTESETMHLHLLNVGKKKQVATRKK